MSANSLGRSPRDPSSWSPYYVNASSTVFYGLMGYTKPLEATFRVNSGVLTLLNITVADVGDGYFDSAVLLEESSLRRSGVAATWDAAAWSRCSTTCGAGTIVRVVRCVSASTGAVAAESECSDPKPSLTSACTTAACMTSSWVASVWGGCSVSCGVGAQSRNVTCQSNSGATLGLLQCLSPMPPIQKPCVAAIADCAAPVYGWAYSAWGKCSITCGRGSRDRLVFCRDSSSQRASETLCRAAKPAVSEACDMPDCTALFGWAYSSWGSCSSACGRGTQSRYVYCLSTNLTVASSESLCSGIGVPKPVGSQACNASCPAGGNAAAGGNAVAGGSTVVTTLAVRWAPSAWSQCSVSCGTGTTTRQLVCVDASNKTLPDARCTAVKPGSLQACESTVAPDCIAR